MREALERWAIKRALNVARAALDRNPTPGRVRALVARGGSLLARRESFVASAPFAVGEANAWWVQPAGGASGAVILYLHGGGFVASSRAIHEPLLAAICREAGGRGLMLDYRLAPEHPFPAALDDSFAAWDLTDVTGGLTLATGRATLAFGVGYAWGSNPIEQAVAPPGQDAPAAAGEAHFNRWTLSFGASFR